MAKPHQIVPSHFLARLHSRDRKTAALCMPVLGALWVASIVGVASSLYLANHYPLLLVALSPLLRHQVLVSTTVDPTMLVLVVTGRRLLSFVVSFYLGRALGPVGLEWLEGRVPRLASFVRWLEHFFDRGAYVAVLFLTGSSISLIAGIAGMRMPVFVSLAAIAVIVRVLLVIQIGHQLREPLEHVLALIEQYWVPGTFAIVVALGLYQWRRRAARGPFDDLA